MKKGILIMIIGVWCYNVHAQFPSRCSVPPELYEAYKEDVGLMAYNWYEKRLDPLSASTQVPQAYQDTIWAGLAAILYSNTPQSDSVFNLYCVHNHFNGWYKTLYFAVDTSVKWTHNWSMENVVTGNLALDTVLENYGYEAEDISTSSFGRWKFAAFKTEQEVYFPAIKQLIEDNATEIDDISPFLYWGTGDWITYEKQGDKLYYEFGHGFGDCPSGCTSELVWVFEVNIPDCKVLFLENRHQIWPGEHDGYVDSCNIFKHSTKTPFLTIYPIPTTDLLSFEAEDIQSIQFVNTLGQMIANQNYDLKDAVTVSTSHLAAGVYIAQVVTAHGSFKRRIVVQ